MSHSFLCFQIYGKFVFNKNKHCLLSFSLSPSAFEWMRDEVTQVHKNAIPLHNLYRYADT